jgi:Rod binding domain-containing protein
MTAAAPAEIQDAAKQFEALLLTQLVRAARSEDGWLDAKDSSAAPAIEFAEEQLAASLAARGGLGLAQLITRSLNSIAPHPPGGR